MNELKAVLFDVDGVLLDSLDPHLKICEDKNREYDLGLKIPSATELKEMARRGIQISPMKYFFMAVGFPEEFAEKADRQYREIFMREYSPAPFPQVHATLMALHNAGIQMGIVTSNVKANVVEALGPSINFFHRDCIFSTDASVGSSKGNAIVEAISRFQVHPTETLYVGDQLADWKAARAADVNFLGVTYGWGISREDRDFPIVETVHEIFLYVLRNTLPSN